jgi:hypothetical protein
MHAFVMSFHDPSDSDFDRYVYLVKRRASFFVYLIAHHGFH